MPRYEYRCRTCDESFELRRSMAEASEPAPCSQGHVDSVRLLSVFASVGASRGSSAGPAPSAPRTAAAGAARAAAAPTDTVLGAIRPGASGTIRAQKPESGTNCAQKPVR